MAPLSKRLFREIQEMQMQTGRMLRNMSFTRMIKLESGSWQPPVDIYESDDEVTVYCDLAGVSKDSLELMVAEDQLHISGRRQLAKLQSIVCIHQLEIELGPFERTVALPTRIDVEHVSSLYLDGILIVSLKKRKIESQIIVRIEVGG